MLGSRVVVLLFFWVLILRVIVFRLWTCCYYYGIRRLFLAVVFGRQTRVCTRVNIVFRKERKDIYTNRPLIIKTPCSHA